MISKICSHGFFRIHWLLVLLGIFTATPSISGLRQIIPRPQQMGVLFEYPMVISGGFYLVIPDDPTASELLVQDEAFRLFQESSLRTPIVVEYSEFTFDIPSIWIGTPDRFPALAEALDSIGLSELGTISHDEEYQIYVDEFRILLLGADNTALHWGLLSLMKIMGEVNGTLHVDRVYIRDWPDYPKRIATINSSMRNESQVNYCLDFADSAYYYKMDEIEWNNQDQGLAPEEIPAWRRVIFLPNAEAFKEKLDSRGMKLTVSCDNTGISVDKNCWQEAVPVYNTQMRVTSSGLQVVPDCYNITVQNNGFESWSNNKPVGWSVYRDYLWSHFSRDRSIRHSGYSSVKIVSDGGGILSLRQLVSLQPYGYYNLRFWVKTSGFSGDFYIDAQKQEVPYNGVIRMADHIDIPSTQDWTEYVVPFSSFHLDEAILMIGSHDFYTGTIWLDDIRIEAAPPELMVRRSDTPVHVYEEPGHVLRTEGVDYRIVETSSTDFEDYVKYPRFERINGGALYYNDLVSIDWGCAVYFQDIHRTVCFSLLEPLQSYQNRVRNADSLLHPDGFKIHINEVCYAGHDQICQSNGLTPAQLVGRYCENMFQIIQARRPGIPVRIYGDAFDYYTYDQRAMPTDTYPWTRGENGEGTLAQLSTDVEIMAMAVYSADLDSTFITYDQYGFSSVIALYADYPISAQLAPVLTARRYPDCLGLIAYGWSSWQWKMPLFSSLGWNLGPYIMHTPVQVSTGSDSLKIEAEIWGDELGSELPSLTSVLVRYRWLPEGNWIEMQMVPTATDHYSTTIPPGGDAVESLEYAISATDSRGQTRRAPAGDGELFVVRNFASTPDRIDRSVMHIDHVVSSVGDFTLIEWNPIEDADYYEVHVGPSPDFSDSSTTRIARQSPQSPRYLIRNDALRSSASINIYAILGENHDSRRSSRK